MLNLFSHIQLFVALWIVGCHALFQETFLTRGMEPVSLTPPTLADAFFTTSTTWKALRNIHVALIHLAISNPKGYWLLFK